MSVSTVYCPHTGIQQSDVETGAQMWFSLVIVRVLLHRVGCYTLDYDCAVDSWLKYCIYNLFLFLWDLHHYRVIRNFYKQFSILLCLPSKSVMLVNLQSDSRSVLTATRYSRILVWVEQLGRLDLGAAEVYAANYGHGLTKFSWTFKAILLHCDLILFVLEELPVLRFFAQWNHRGIVIILYR